MSGMPTAPDPNALPVYDRNRLTELVREHSLRFGDFTLASGKKASFYLDCRCVTLHPQGAVQIAAGMLAWLRGGGFGDFPQAIGGMAIGADPVTAACVYLAGLQNTDLRGFMVRKEAKQHGMGKQVEGPVAEGMSCVVVEDVVTTGGSAIAAIDAVERAGMRVLGVLAVLDRKDGGEAAIAARGHKLHSLLSLADLGVQA
jgi:orotate phosphoribosyltransferase